MTNNFTEATIRDHLAVQLDLIESGLTLIQKEHYLKNISGANGFVDILAKDRFNNYVVIEVKRSQQSSRQTIQELFKYIALLKQNHHARDSEIRCIIVSTHWSELLVPFSELYHQTTLDVKGIKLSIDENFHPTGTEKIQPLKITTLQRRFSPVYWLDLFHTADKRDASISIIKDQCIAFSLKDFVIVSMDANGARERGIIYPFAICFAFQSQSVDTYLDLLQDSEDLEPESEFETQEEYIDYLENLVQCAVLKGDYADSGEAASPEQFDSELTRDNWKISHIAKFGVFGDDPRCDEDFLIKELKGLDGNNQHKFFNICESTQRNRLAEIKEKCQITTFNNANWLKHIQQIFDHLESLNSPFRMMIHIYSPKSVFDSMVRTTMGLPHDYLPMYIIYADFLEKDELLIFHGQLTWNGKEPNSTDIVSFFKDEKNVFMSKFIDSTLGHHDHKIMKLFQLNYHHSIKRLNNGVLNEDYAFKFKDGKIKKTNDKLLTIHHWIKSNTDLAEFLPAYAKTEAIGY